MNSSRAPKAANISSSLASKGVVRVTPLDALFDKHRGEIPLHYLRSLAYRESGLDPQQVHPKSHATGLFQITQVALTGFNKAHGANLSLQALKDPELNTKVATDHIQRILRKYATVQSLLPDWSNPRFVALLTNGWNAGHNALAALARSMEKIGIAPERITPATIQQAAQAKVDASPEEAKRSGVVYLADPGRASWAEAVARTYTNGGAVPAAAVRAAEIGVVSTGNSLSGVAKLGGGLIVASLAGLALYRFHQGTQAQLAEAT